MKLDHLLVESDGGLLRVTVNRPEKRNALSRAVLDEIATVFSSHADDARLRLAVLTGAGDRSFAAGGDLRDLASVRTFDEASAMGDDARRALRTISEFPLPVVAALNGDALGGGAELAVACDFIVAARGARIGFIQGRLNISTAWGGGIRLMDRVGMARALRLLCRSEVLTAADAEAMGLVDAIADAPEELCSVVDRFCAPMLDKAPRVLRAFKELTLSRSEGLSRSDLENIEARRFAETWVHDDHWTAADKVLAPGRTP